MFTPTPFFSKPKWETKSMEKENILQNLSSLKSYVKYVLGLICLLISMQTHLEAGVIQNLVNAASPGSTVVVPPGTYVEQVVINKNLTLQGSGVGVTIIQCPGIMVNSFLYTTTGVTYVPIIMVEGANVSSVNIQDLTVDGLGLGTSNVQFAGIGYHNGGGIIQNVQVTNIRDNILLGSQSGHAILDAIDDGNSYSMSVLNSTLTNFQKTGILMRGFALSVNISGNTITGNNPFIIGQAAPNGILLRNSAIGTITNNTISKCSSTNALAGAAGILLFGAGTNLVVQNNNVTDNDIGIASVNTGDQLNVSNNQVNVNNNIGILIQDTVGLTTLTSNTMQNNTNQNMQLFDSVLDAPFNLASNIFIGSIVGLLVEGNNTGTTGPIVTMNSDSFVGTLGYYIQEISAPHDIWPSTATVSFDGLTSGNMTFAQFLIVLTKIFDKHNDPALGLVLDFIPLFL